MNLIQGGIHKDLRGNLIHFNEFDMTEIKRFYTIEPSNTQTVRAWQGHQKERKWFYCYNGSFLLKIIAIDNWSTPSLDLPIQEQVLEASVPIVIQVPGGYANGFQALELNSSLMVFSDFELSASAKDDFRFPVDYWKW